MVAVTVNYAGGLSCRAMHEPSGTELTTHAPADNGGTGAGFSPTDLTVTSLLSCIMTTMAIYARRQGLELDGMNGRAEKTMAANPRRIAEINMVIQMPVTADHAMASGLKTAAQGCPVHLTLSPETRMVIDWRWAV